MSEDGLQVEVDAAARTAVVTLDRPERRNALDRALLAALRGALTELDADEGVGAVVLTGADPAFCSGVDLKTARVETVARPADGPLLPPLETPLIAAVNGPAVTGGLELVLCCDFAVASERASFADTHARLGSLPFWGLTARLPAAVGGSRALRLILAGETVDAGTADRWGLVTEVVPHDELLPLAGALAAVIAAADADTVRALLALFRAGQTAVAEQLLHERAAVTPWHERLELEQRWQAANAGPAAEPRRADQSPTAAPPAPGS